MSLIRNLEKTALPQKLFPGTICLYFLHLKVIPGRPSCRSQKTVWRGNYMSHLFKWKMGFALRFTVMRVLVQCGRKKSKAPFAEIKMHVDKLDVQLRGKKKQQKKDQKSWRLSLCTLAKTLISQSRSMYGPLVWCTCLFTAYEYAI